MSSLVIFFTVFVAVIDLKHVDSSATVQDIDVDKLVDFLQRKQRSNQDSSDSDDSQFDDSDSYTDDSNVRTERILGNDVIDLLKELANSKDNERISRVHRNRKESYNNVFSDKKRDNSNSRSENSQRSDDIANIVSLLISKDSKGLENNRQLIAKSPKKHLIPNRLLWNEGKKSENGLEDYSKIYILLNPKAVQKTKNNKSAINQLISKILSLSAPSAIQSHQGSSRQNRLFALKENAVRRRGSREMYAPDDSMEDKPKRGRNNGGGAGHTAIPYIRHRGENIYERE